MISSHSTASIIRGAFWTASVAVVLVALYPVAIKVRRRQSLRPDGIEVVHNPSNANFEIVAVHGLGAHSEHTWEGKPIGQDHAKFHLLRDLLPRDFPTARILSFAYNSDWLVDAPEKTAQQIGQRLLNGLAVHRGNAKQRLPIIFIGHSFGGIVIKEALCATKPPMAILDDTCGVVFLGTPHQGSSLSTAGALMAKLTGFLGSNTTLLLALRSDESRLSGLEVEFRRLVNDKKLNLASKIMSFYETKPTFILGWLSVGLVVDRNSAMGYAPEPVDIDTDHSGLNKFSDHQQPGYRAIKKAIEELREPSLIEQADAYIRKNHYNEEKLRIERLSGKFLVMEECYINLALVELQRADNSERRSNEPSARSSPFSLSDRLKVETPHKDLQVELAKLFQSRKLPDGRTKEPRRILIRGRAGVGKTTLCKKIVHSYTHESMWRGLFRRVVWIRMRELKGLSDREYNLGGIFEHVFFRQHAGDDCLHTELSKHIESTDSQDTLFLLDGLDEVTELVMEHKHGRPHSGHDFLIGLLNKPNVIITTRPHTTLPSRFQRPDIELDTIGFYPDQVQKYIETVMKENPTNAKAIQSYLQKNRFMQSLVRIPIQLDALCYTWNPNSKATRETMTTVYEDITQQLWSKDIERLEKSSTAGTRLPAETKYAVLGEIEILEYMAFSGMCSNIIEFQSVHRNVLCQHIKQRSPKWTLDETFGRLSFLRTSDPSAQHSNQSYHFIHLTFHEFFAAKYFAQRWKDGNNLKYMDFSLREDGCSKIISPDTFLQQHKYTARYDIFWRFVAGLLDDEGKDESTRFFKALERKPVDLLGPTHQRLVMNCLREAVFLPFEIRSNREKRLKDWVLFEINLTESSTFTRESELPDGVLQDALGASRNKRAILDNLRYPGRHMSDTTTTALVELLKDENGNVRWSVASALGKQSTLPETTVTALMELFKHEDSDVRWYAALALHKQSTLSETTVTALMELFKHEDSDVRSSAADALGKQSTLSETTTTALVELLKDENSNVRRSAALALHKQSTLSEMTVTALMELFKHEDSGVRSSAARALGEQSTLPETTMTALVELFKDENSNVRLSAADALGKQSTLSETTMTALVELLKDEDWDVRRSAALALGKQSTLSEMTMTALVQLLKDEDSYIRRSAAGALGKQSILSETAMTALVELFKDEDSNVRSSAADALGKQSTLSETTMTALVELFKHENSDVRHSAASALGKQSTLSETTMTALVELFKDENGNVRLSAADALGKQSTLSEMTMTALVELLKDEDSYVRSSAASALGAQSTLSEMTMTALVELFKDENSDVRLSAASALGKQSTLSETTMTALVELFKDKNSNVRLSAASALDKQSTLPETTMTALVELLKDEDSYVRSSAASALGKQSTLSEMTVTALMELFKHEDSDVRSSAADALGTQPNLIDKVLDALGLVIRSELQAEMQASVFCYSQHIGPLYESFLRRSFQEQFSLCIDDNLCIVNQPSGLRTVGLEDSSQVQTAVQNGRCNLRNIGRYKLWDTFEGEDA